MGIDRDINIGKMNNVGFEAFHWHLSDFLTANPEMRMLLGTNSMFGGNEKRFQEFLLGNENVDIIKKYYLSVIQNLSIWVEPSFYSRLPHLLPYSIRERTSSYDRLKKSGKDNWGESNKNGFVIDDNTDIKDFIRKSGVKNSKYYANQIPYTGFIGCHIWEDTTDNPMLFSYIPNIVWLPTPIARLSDNSSSVFSRILKQVSKRLYSDVTFRSKELESIVNEINLLLENETENLIGDFLLNKYTIPYICVSIDKISKKVQHNIEEILFFMEKFMQNKDFMIPENKRLIHGGYLPTLAMIIKENPNSISESYNWFIRYFNALKETTKNSNQAILG